MSDMYVYGVGFTYIEPGCCSVPFMMSEAHYNKSKKEKSQRAAFYCPNCGKARIWVGKTEEQKLKEQLKQQQQKTFKAQSEALIAKNSAKALRAVASHIRARINNGVCPCCTRYFKNLHRHMQTKHKGHLSSMVRLKTFRKEQLLTQCEVAEQIGVESTHISLFENGKQVAAWAKEEIDIWVEENL